MANETNSITCVAFNGERYARISLEHALYQYDYGQVIQFTDINLPPVFEAHFSNDPLGQSKIQVGTGNYVAIPDSMLRSGAQVSCWVFLHDDDNDGRTVYRVDIPVIRRAARGFERINGNDVNAIGQLITSYNSGIERIETVEQEAVSHRNDALVAKGLAENARDTAVQAASVVSGFIDKYYDGSVGSILTRIENDDADWIAPASDFEGDNTRPVTASLLLSEIQRLEAMIQLIGNDGGNNSILKVVDTNYVLDHTWQEIYDAISDGKYVSVIIGDDGDFIQLHVISAYISDQPDSYMIALANSQYYKAVSANGYPEIYQEDTVQQEPEGS